MPGYAVLMSPNKDETAVHRSHCSRGVVLCAQGVLPIVGGKGRLRPKGVPFLRLRYTKG